MDMGPGMRMERGPTQQFEHDHNHDHPDQQQWTDAQAAVPESADISPIDRVVFQGGGDDSSPVWSHVARHDAGDRLQAARSTVKDNEEMLRALLHKVRA